MAGNCVRMNHILYESVQRCDALAVLDEMGDAEKKMYRKAKQAAMVHAAAVFDVSESSLYWFRDGEDVVAYLSVLFDVIVMELPDILDSECEEDAQYATKLSAVYEQMVSHLSNVGRQKSDAALERWSKIENSTVTDLRKRKLLFPPPLFLDAAPAYLALQASSASVERLFGDAGYHEGARRQHSEPSVTEMLFSIHSFAQSRIENADRQPGFLNTRVQAAKNLFEEISVEIERFWSVNTNY